MRKRGKKEERKRIKNLELVSKKCLEAKTFSRYYSCDKKRRYQECRFVVLFTWVTSFVPDAG